MHSVIKICLFSAMFITAVQSIGRRVKVDVYYEVKCPFARAFFTKQLYPALQGRLAQYINLTLVPYGKATTYRTQTGIKFDCHHGPTECYGNKIQACALKIIEDDNKNAGLGYSKTTLAFLNCLMDTTNAKNSSYPNTDECAKLTDVTDDDVGNITACAYSNRGSLYLAKLGNQTRNMQNPLANVPSIVFSEEYKKEESDLAEKDFIKALCAKIQGEKPAECYRNSGIANRPTEIRVGVLLIAMVACYFY